MKLNEFLLTESDSVQDLQAQLKVLQKELVGAKSGGNDDVAEQLKIDIAELKEMIKDAQS